MSLVSSSLPSSLFTEQTGSFQEKRTDTDSAVRTIPRIRSKKNIVPSAQPATNENNRKLKDTSAQPKHQEPSLQSPREHRSLSHSLLDANEGPLLRIQRLKQMRQQAQEIRHERGQIKKDLAELQDGIQQQEKAYDDLFRQQEDLSRKNDEYFRKLDNWRLTLCKQNKLMADLIDARNGLAQTTAESRKLLSKVSNWLEQECPKIDRLIQALYPALMLYQRVLFDSAHLRLRGMGYDSWQDLKNEDGIALHDGVIYYMDLFRLGREGDFSEAILLTSDEVERCILDDVTLDGISREDYMGIFKFAYGQD